MAKDFEINKGLLKPLEFQGLRAQYIAFAIAGFVVAFILYMLIAFINSIVAIITALISNQADIESVLIFIFFMLAIVAMIYGLIWLVRSVVGILQTQRRNKLDYFITDLQGVLDVVFIFNRSNNEQGDIVAQK
jgi:uncharacterized membrane protein